MDGILVQQMSSEMTGGHETCKVLKLPLWLSHGLLTPGNTYPTAGPFGKKIPAQWGNPARCLRKEGHQPSGVAPPHFFPFWVSVWAHQPRHDLDSKAANSSSSLRGADLAGLLSLTGSTGEMRHVQRQTCSLQRCCSLLNLSFLEVKRWSRILNSSLSAHNRRQGSLPKTRVILERFHQVSSNTSTTLVLIPFSLLATHTNTLGAWCYFLKIICSKLRL